MSNARGLLGCELVIALFRKQKRARAHRLNQQLHLEIQSLRVLGEGVSESAFEGSSTLLSPFKLPAVCDFVKNFL